MYFQDMISITTILHYWLIHESSSVISCHNPQSTMHNTLMLSLSHHKYRHAVI